VKLLILQVLNVLNISCMGTRRGEVIYGQVSAENRPSHSHGMLIRVMHHVSDIATDPNLKWQPGRVVNGKQRYEVVGEREGEKIKVIIEPAGEGIITAFPIK
jgi:hypothetical protein